MAPNPADIYRDIFATLTNLFSIRTERGEDGGILFEIYQAIQRQSDDRLGLAGLDPAMLRTQFQWRERAYRDGRPGAMRLIVENADGPIGRFIIDWADARQTCHGVDLAVHPRYRRGAAGLALLRAWLATADRLGRAATLEVMPDNPAGMIYQRLGFVVEDPTLVPVPMRRAIRCGRGTGSGTR